MKSNPLRFSIERQEIAGGEWRAVTRCNTLSYARIIAAAGLSRHTGACYRAVHNLSGRTFDLSQRARSAGA